MLLLVVFVCAIFGVLSVAIVGDSGVTVGDSFGVFVCGFCVF